MSFFAITQFNVDLLILGVGAAAIGLLGTLTFFNNPKSVTNTTFFAFSLVTILWATSNFFEYKFDSIEAVLFALRLHLFISVWHAYLFFRLCFVFPKSEVRFPAWHSFLILPIVMLTALSTLSPFVFSGIDQLAPVGQVTDPERGPGIIVFSIVAFGLLFLGLVSLCLRALKSEGVIRRQLWYVFLGMFFTAALIIAFNVVLPVAFGDLRFIPYASLFMLPFIALISYSIYRHKLFNLKVFAAGTMVFLLAGLTFFEVVFTSDVSLLIFRGALLLLVLVAGTQLIRSVMKEIEQREHIEQLASELKEANEKLKELDKLKSQFLSIASHDLRAPLTVIRNYVSLVLDGSYGKMPKAAEEGLHQVFERATDMAKSVDTYLNVSRIEQGRMKYDFIDVDLAPILKKAVTDFKTNAEKKGLVLNIAIAGALEGKKAKVDVAKLNEVLNNLLDNSIKYTPKGSISVTAELVGNIARLTIKDTGIGMSKETISKLFQLFSTGESSLKVNISSTGVGLYITKAHVLAHKGRVWAESDGEGKGSRFVLELPLLN
jgi:signal transduction histidine kinase